MEQEFEFNLTLIGTKEQIRECALKALEKLKAFDANASKSIDDETFAHSLPLEKQCNVKHLIIEGN